MFAEYEYIYLIFIILLFVFLRARKQIRGRKANIRSIFTRPLLYIVLTLLLLAATPNADVLVSALLFSVLGYLLGTKLGVRSKVFEKDGVILSKGIRFSCRRSTTPTSMTWKMTLCLGSSAT